VLSVVSVNALSALRATDFAHLPPWALAVFAVVMALMWLVVLGGGIYLSVSWFMKRRSAARRPKW